MVNDKDNVYWGDLEDKDFHEVAEITAPKEENVNGKQ
jgi:hypothetical protein